jgi:hypothetical protein
LGSSHLLITLQLANICCRTRWLRTSVPFWHQKLFIVARIISCIWPAVQLLFLFWATI